MGSIPILGIDPLRRTGLFFIDGSINEKLVEPVVWSNGAPST
jgi:hypothetical protein